jgi:hypothetical protein
LAVSECGQVLVEVLIEVALKSYEVAFRSPSRPKLSGSSGPGLIDLNQVHATASSGQKYVLAPVEAGSQLRKSEEEP